MIEHEMCFWAKGFQKVHIINVKIRKIIERWEKAKMINTYFNPDGTMAWDFIIPSKYCKRLVRLLSTKSKENNPN